MQGCKAYRLCSVAVLNELGKEWWIDMKNVQISEELFVAIMRYFILEQEELLPQIMDLWICQCLRWNNIHRYR